MISEEARLQRELEDAIKAHATAQARLDADPTSAEKCLALTQSRNREGDLRRRLRRHVFLRGLKR